jgi:hypothetical protein
VAVARVARHRVVLRNPASWLPLSVAVLCLAPLVRKVAAGAATNGAESPSARSCCSRDEEGSVCLEHAARSSCWASAWRRLDADYGAERAAASTYLIAARRLRQSSEVRSQPLVTRPQRCKCDEKYNRVRDDSCS